MSKNFLKSILIENLFLKLYDFFIYYIITQNIISIAILPIYSAWGLKFSSLTFLSNLVFIPFLNITIISSLLIFIGMIFKITFTPLIFFFNNFLEFWFYLINFISNKSISFYFIHSNLYFFICWPISYFLISNKKIKSKKEIWALITTLSFLFCLFIFLIKKPEKNYIVLEKYEKPIIVINNKKKIYVFDYSISKATKKTFCSSWINFKLKMDLAKNFGNTNIKSYFLCK